MTACTPAVRPFADAALRGHALAGLLLIGAGIGGFSLFAATVPLSSGIVAAGLVQPETGRKTVQHLEGGIVAEIAVREGQRVEAGDLLARLDDTRVRASLDTLRAALRDVRATEARLDAEIILADAPAFPADLLERADAAETVGAQRRLFEARRRSLANQIEILTARRRQLDEAREGLDAQSKAARSQLESRRTERVGLETLAARGFLARARLDEQGREIARLEGVVGALDGQIAANRASVSEAELQALQVRQAHVQRAGDALAEVLQQKAQLVEKIRVAEDAVARGVVRAPVAGTVQGLRVVTKGGVVTPGEALMDIVPVADRLIMEARVPVGLADDLAEGAGAEVRFPTFNARDLGEIEGRVSHVSADAMQDATTGARYYRAEVDVDPRRLPQTIAARLRPGLPVDVIIVGEARTLADYLLEPVRAMMRGALREPPAGGPAH